MADAGTLGAFADFMVATRDLPLSTPDKISNQMTRHQTYLSRLMMKDLPESAYFKTGRRFIEQIQLKYTGTAVDYLPTDEHTPTGQNTLTEFKVPWRYKMVHKQWYDQEIELNEGADQKTRFKDLAKAKRQAMFTDFWDSVNDNLWAQPANAMEGDTDSGRTPFSIRHFVTIGTGVPNTTAIASGGDGALDAITTIEGINPTTYPNWDNQRLSYTAANIDSELEDKFDEMYTKLMWEAPEEGGGKTGMVDSQTQKLHILTNREGYLACIRIARAQRSAEERPSQQLRMGAGRVNYNGVRIKYISALDSTSITPAGSPRFWFVNFNHIHPVFHRRRYLFPKTFEGTVTQPLANAEYRDTWWNLLCRNRREQRILYAA